MSTLIGLVVLGFVIMGAIYLASFVVYLAAAIVVLPISLVAAIVRRIRGDKESEWL